MPAAVLCVLPTENYFEIVARILKKRLAWKRTVHGSLRIVYVAVNKPVQGLAVSLKQAGIPSLCLFVFVDCVSRLPPKGNPPLSEGTCFFAESPENLTGISIAIQEAIRSVPEKKLLLFDSLSALLLYHGTEDVAKFAGFLVNRLRSEGIETMLFAFDSGAEKELFRQIELLVDNVKQFKD